jgi:hypothetical protein
VQFVTRAQVPDEVVALRVADRTVRGAAVGSEEVLLYRRQLVLRAEQGAPVARGLALRQIIRLNLRHFLTRLDEPEHADCHFAPREGRFRDVRLPKVYHINLVARVKSAAAEAHSQRWRVVLNKEGIVRIETVSARHPVAAPPTR